MTLFRMNSTPQHIHFVTGRLAEHAVRYNVAQVAEQLQFEYSIAVLPITVAALMNPKWLFRNLEIPATATRVILPGHLAPDIEEIRARYTTPIECGPRDIRDLSRYFGGKQLNQDDYGEYAIEIIAEINHAPRLSLKDLLREAELLVADGANTIDLGCTPGHQWRNVGDAVRCLRDVGIRVSIDSFDMFEVAEACRAGASLVLSVNSSNREHAMDWGCEVVVIPDTPSDKKSFQETIDFLSDQRVSMRLDPILEPIGFGFAESLQRYMACRERFPDASMMMGIGNITELTDVDSAGVNVVLLGICQELGIQSVLTTQVINWARTSVKECDLARRLVHFACTQKVPPKHLEANLLMLRDAKVNEFTPEAIAAMGQAIRDKNVRLFNSASEIHAVSAGVHARSSDPFDVMRQLLHSELGSSIDPSHAFYLGFEMAKALTALTLDKQYEQDQALDWGFLTRPEDHHRLKRGKQSPPD
jgi:dihydropteroate synthase-like protein